MGFLGTIGTCRRGPHRASRSSHPARHGRGRARGGDSRRRHAAAALRALQPRPGGGLRHGLSHHPHRRRDAARRSARSRRLSAVREGHDHRRGQRRRGRGRRAGPGDPPQPAVRRRAARHRPARRRAPRPGAAVRTRAAGDRPRGQHRGGPRWCDRRARAVAQDRDACDAAHSPLRRSPAVRRARRRRLRPSLPREGQRPAPRPGGDRSHAAGERPDGPRARSRCAHEPRDAARRALAPRSLGGRGYRGGQRAAGGTHHRRRPRRAWIRRCGGGAGGGRWRAVVGRRARLSRAHPRRPREAGRDRTRARGRSPPACAHRGPRLAGARAHCNRASPHRRRTGARRSARRRPRDAGAARRHARHAERFAPRRRPARGRDGQRRPRAGDRRCLGDHLGRPGSRRARHRRGRRGHGHRARPGARVAPRPGARRHGERRERPLRQDIARARDGEGQSRRRRRRLRGRTGGARPGRAPERRPVPVDRHGGCRLAARPRHGHRGRHRDGPRRGRGAARDPCHDPPRAGRRPRRAADRPQPGDGAARHLDARPTGGARADGQHALRRPAGGGRRIPARLHRGSCGRDRAGRRHRGMAEHRPRRDPAGCAPSRAPAPPRAPSS